MKKKFIINFLLIALLFTIFTDQSVQLSPRSAKSEAPSNTATEITENSTEAEKAAETKNTQITEDNSSVTETTVLSEAETAAAVPATATKSAGAAPTAKVTTTTKKATVTTKKTEATTKKSTETTKKMTTTTKKAAETIKVSSIGSSQQEVLRLINAERTKNGLAALKYCSTVQKTADVRVNEIVQKFDHTRPNGKKYYTVFDDLGYSSDYFCCAENIAAGCSSPQVAVSIWMDSAGHRANILSNTAKRIVIGVKDDYYVLLFIK